MAPSSHPGSDCTSPATPSPSITTPQRYSLASETTSSRTPAQRRTRRCARRYSPPCRTRTQASPTWTLVLIARRSTPPRLPVLLPRRLTGATSRVVSPPAPGLPARTATTTLAALLRTATCSRTGRRRTSQPTPPHRLPASALAETAAPLGQIGRTPQARHS